MNLKWRRLSGKIYELTTVKYNYFNNHIMNRLQCISSWFLSEYRNGKRLKPKRYLWMLLVFVFISAGPLHLYGQDQSPERKLALLTPKVFINPGETQYSSTRRVFQGIPGIERASNGRLWVSRFSGGVGCPIVNTTLAIDFPRGCVGTIN